MMVKVFSTNFIIKRFYSGVTNKIRAQKYVLTKYFVGEPKKNDFEIIEEELPELKDGEILTEAEYLSVDPYMRAYMIGYKLPAEMIGGQVAKVIESRNKDIPVGSYVTGMFGWCTHKIINPSIVNPASMLPLTVVPDIKPHPVSLALGILGMPGNTAYFGLKEICTPKPGETIVITGAAGAVGSHVGQIGKILGCRVIGFAGTDEKCHYLEKELGFDHAYNYKTCKIRDALKQGAPNRVDCYFDNVGGEISTTVMNHMNKFGRVAVCGSISSYNDITLPKVSIVQPAIVFKELKVEGFLVHRWLDRWQEGINENLKWLSEGKLKYEEKVYHGFENMVEALVGILRGENTVFSDSKNIEKQFHAVADEISCKFVLGQNKILKSFKCEIHDYFDKKLRKFTTPIKLLGTEFQKEVWNKLLEIPYGSTQTYGSLAKEMGRPASHSRAVGAACGANPLLLVIPCHRLVASGSKGGFSCGMDRKEWLISHENKSSEI